MSEFLTAHEKMFAEIETSHKSLEDLKAVWDKFSNEVYWLLQEKSSLERNAANIDLLNKEKEKISEEEKIELGKLEAHIADSMTLLNKNMKNINKTLTVLPDPKTITTTINTKMWASRRKFEKAALDILDYKFNKYGNVDVKKRNKTLRPIDIPYEEFATATLKSSEESRLNIEAHSSPCGAKFTHRISKITQGGENVYDSSQYLRLLAVNGRYVCELSGEEFKKLIKREIETGTVVLDVRQIAPIRPKPTKAVQFKTIENNDLKTDAVLVKPVAKIEIEVEQDKVDLVKSTDSVEEVISVSENLSSGSQEHLEAKTPLTALRLTPHLYHFCRWWYLYPPVN